MFPLTYVLRWGRLEGMSALWQYIKRNAQTSFAIWERGEAAAVLIGAALAAVLALLSIYGLQIIFEFDIGAVFAGLLVAWFAFIVLIITPYRIWKDDKRRITELEEKIAPRIKIIHSEERTEPHGSSDPDIRTVCLCVKNLSPVEILDNCLVTLKNWEDDQGNTSAFPEIALRTFYQLTMDKMGPFYLRPEEEKLIPLARLKEKEPNAEIELGYADPKNYRPYLPKDRRYTFVIQAMANKGGSDIKQYSLWVDEEGKLSLAQE